MESSPALSSDGKILYVGSGDFNLYAINTVDGSKNWNFTTGGAVESSPALSSDGKILYVGSGDHNLYAINTIEGGKNWNFSTGAGVFSSPALSSDGKVVYVGSNDHNIYSIVDNCYQETCASHGTCVNSRTSYTCDCTPGYTGKDCGAIDYCHHGINVTCSDHGSCVNSNSSYTCSCTQGYFGKSCAWHVLPPYAYGVVGGILVAVAGCWLLFCRRKPSNTYDTSSYSQIQQQPAQDVGTNRYNKATESNYENLPVGRTRVGMAVRQCRQCNTRAPAGTERFCRSCGATI